MPATLYRLVQFRSLAGVRVTRRFVSHDDRPVRAYWRPLTLGLLFLFLFAALSCGTSPAPSTSSLISGNWQLTLTRHNSTQQWIFSGFLVQSGSNVTGSFVLNSGCQGVGPVSGTLSGQNLQFTVGTFGQDFSLTATLPSGGSSQTSMSGQFSTLQGGCVGFESSGTWTAVRIPPLSGPFQGSFVALGQNAMTVNVNGSLAQGPNVGASNASLTGTLNATGSPSFCSYIGNATVTGLITGTSVTLNIYGPDGSLIGQVPGPPNPPATVTVDGSSLTGTFVFPAISSSCNGFVGSLTLTFH